MMLCLVNTAFKTPTRRVKKDDDMYFKEFYMTVKMCIIGFLRILKTI